MVPDTRMEYFNAVYSAPSHSLSVLTVTLHNYIYSALCVNYNTWGMALAGGH
jgi:hypothetical protein